jgi:hypothetical protein
MSTRKYLHIATVENLIQETERELESKIHALILINYGIQLKKSLQHMILIFVMLNLK